MLGIIGKSILKNDVSLQVLYDSYYPIITDILRPFRNGIKIDGLDSLSDICNRDSFDTFLRSNGFVDVKKKLQDVVKELRRWARRQQNNKNNLKMSDGAKQKVMRCDLITRLDDLISCCDRCSTEFQKNKEDYNVIIEKLKNARDILKEIYLPRDNKIVDELYELIGSYLDDIDIEFRLVNKESITIFYIAEQVLVAVNKWKQIGN